jgi:hypothetical protein
MNVWMKRGLQTALLTGGLLAVGSGIASADESIDVTVPVTVTDNAVAVLGTSPGTTAPEITLPAVDGDVRADLGAATVSVPVTVAGNRADAAGVDVAQPTAEPVAEPVAEPAAEPAPTGSDTPAVDVDVPVTGTGNAVAVLGEATASGTAPAQGPDGGASIADVDVPVTVCGTGIAVLGDATATCTTPAANTEGGPGHGGQTAPLQPTQAGQQPDTAALPARTDVLLGGALGTAGPAVATGPAVSTNRAVTNGPAVISGTTGLTGTAATSGTRAGNTPGNGSSSTGALASTGADVALVALGGFLTLLAGLGLTVRRRRAATLG